MTRLAQSPVESVTGLWKRWRFGPCWTLGLLQHTHPEQNPVQQERNGHHPENQLEDAPQVTEQLFHSLSVAEGALGQW